ncbi:hypothetical protein [Endozoicomonas sp. ONNA2]|uniref:hypothetical protein n=1 Tax=Endozoicomonas sp. ONNA2 TaxID=2828741 RepID=UPI002148EFEF|nr:hypothetical protein [Endozoicomonas sp. ONNA2]
MAPILEDVLAEQLLRLNPWLATLQKESGNSPTATVLRELRKFWQENLLEANQNALGVGDSWQQYPAQGCPWPCPQRPLYGPGQT